MGTINPAKNYDLNASDDIPIEQFDSQVGFTLRQDPGEAYQSYVTSTGTINDEITYTIPPIRPGTWTVTVLGTKGPDKGIVTVYHGATSLGTLDFYDAAEAAGSVSASFNIFDGTETSLTLKLQSKNASSSSYGARFNRIAISIE